MPDSQTVWRPDPILVGPDTCIMMSFSIYSDSDFWKSLVPDPDHI
jgi:hypothetical protein